MVNPALPVQPKLSAACAVERIDLNAFEFDDMPFPGRTLGRENKYSKTLKDMPVNKRLKVPIGDAAVVKHGMGSGLQSLHLCGCVPARFIRHRNNDVSV